MNFGIDRGQETAATSNIAHPSSVGSIGRAEVSETIRADCTDDYQFAPKIRCRRLEWWFGANASTKKAKLLGTAFVIGANPHLRIQVSPLPAPFVSSDAFIHSQLHSFLVETPLEGVLFSFSLPQWTSHRRLPLGALGRLGVSS
jgi:hypothetical protein